MSVPESHVATSPSPTTDERCVGHWKVRFSHGRNPDRDRLFIFPSLAAPLSSPLLFLTTSSAGFHSQLIPTQQLHSQWRANYFSIPWIGNPPPPKFPWVVVTTPTGARRCPVASSRHHLVSDASAPRMRRSWRFCPSRYSIQL